MEGDDLTVLVVDDNDGCRELFALWLEPDHEVWTAPDGGAALEALDATVDLVVLDREMPGKTGIEVARAIADGELDPHVVMVSSAAPDFDLVDVPIHDFVRKPILEDDLATVVEEYRTQQAYRTALQQYFTLTAKVAALEANQPEEALAESDQYARLRWLVDEKRAQVDEALSRSESDWSVTFKTCTAPGDPAGERSGV